MRIQELDQLALKLGIVHDVEVRPTDDGRLRARDRIGKALGITDHGIGVAAQNEDRDLHGAGVRYGHPTVPHDGGERLPVCAREVGEVTERTCKAVGDRAFVLGDHRIGDRTAPVTVLQHVRSDAAEHRRTDSPVLRKEELKHVASPHGVAHAEARIDVEVVEQRKGVTHHRTVGVRLGIVRFVRVTVATLIQDDRSIVLVCQRIDDPRADPVDECVGRVAVEEENRHSVPREFIGEGGSVEGLELRHGVASWPMTGLEYQSRPELRRSILIIAFQGWSDAGDAASGSIDYLRTLWNATRFASIDPEEFYDFQMHRPIVAIDDEGVRQITWPTTDFAHASVAGADRDAVLSLGSEPSMRWPTFCRHILDVASTSNAELVIGLGALLAGRPHTRPIRVTGTAASPEVTKRFGLATPRYEGPTGILGVLMNACRQQGLDAVTLWAWVPHYLQGAPSPAASLALLQRLGALLELTVDLSDLEERARSHESRVDEAVSSDPDIAATVQELERQADAEELDEIPSGEELAAEVERFLRNQRPER